MARNDIDAERAYEMLRAHSQRTGQKLSEIARAITESHTFFPKEPS
jgi:AmiR/NasT family two-component response regulator